MTGISVDDDDADIMDAPGWLGSPSKIEKNESLNRENPQSSLVMKINTTIWNLLRDGRGIYKYTCVCSKR
jgi:hypothetical protein